MGLMSHPVSVVSHFHHFVNLLAAESMFHDHGPANKFGLSNCWIYRRHEREGFGATMNPGEMPTYDFCFNSMADLAEAHRVELAGKYIV